MGKNQKWIPIHPLLLSLSNWIPWGGAKKGLGGKKTFDVRALAMVDVSVFGFRRAPVPKRAGKTYRLWSQVVFFGSLKAVHTSQGPLAEQTGKIGQRSISAQMMPNPGHITSQEISTSKKFIDVQTKGSSTKHV